MAIKLYGAVSRDCIIELRRFVRETGLRRPRLSHAQAARSPLGYPLVVFEFVDYEHAFHFWERFNLAPYGDDTPERLEEQRRELLAKNIKTLGLPPALEAKALADLIASGDPFARQRSAA